MSKCLECSNLDLQSHPKHALVGFGKCKFEKLPGVLMSFAVKRDCNKFARADETVISKRIDWYKKNDQIQQ